MAAPDLEHELRFVGAALQRQVADAAKRAAIPCRARTMRDDPLGALAKACAENGPWNVVAIAEPFAATDDKRLREVFASVIDTTGVMVAGATARIGSACGIGGEPSRVWSSRGAPPAPRTRESSCGCRNGLARSGR